MINVPGHQKYIYPVGPVDDDGALERRIQEEAGPVKTYQAIEWFGRSIVGRYQIIVNIEKTGVRLNRAAYRAIGEPAAIRFGWDNLRGGLIIRASKRDDAQAYAISKRTAAIGGAALARRIAERLPYGRYEGKEDGTGCLFVSEKSKMGRGERA